MGALATITRMTRSSMLEVLSQDYIRTARAKGLAERRVLVRHALRNASMPTLTMIGLSLGWLMGGSVLVETIFDWPGWALRRELGIDSPTSCRLWESRWSMALLFSLINLTVDVLYG
ncbi:MAG: ABC transporter permease [Thermomicrobiales bacterium]